MVLRVLATSFLMVWLSILGVEFSEDMGAFDYDDPNLDNSMHATLDGFGNAIKAPDAGAEASPLPIKAAVLSVALASLAICAVSFGRPEALAMRPQKEGAIYQLHSVLLL